MATILHACTEKNLVHVTTSTRLYTVTMKDKKGGDLPGGAQGKVAWIVMDRKGREVNHIDSTWARDMDVTLNKAKELRSALLVITSSKHSGFGVGSDLEDIYKETTIETGKKNHENIRRIFSRILTWEQPTISVIHGSCLGASLELALSTKIRVAVAGTSLGLPDLKTGVLPSHTAMTKLPKLIGLQKALDIVLRSRILSATYAYEINLVDYLLEVSSELDVLLWNVLAASASVTLRRDLTRNEQWLQATVPGKLYLKYSHRAKAELLYPDFPGGLLAVDAMLVGNFYGAQRGEAHAGVCGSTLQVTDRSKMLIKHKLAMREVIQLTKGKSEEKGRGDGERKPSLAVVGSVEEVAVALMVAMKKGVFCMLCGESPNERIRVIDEMVNMMDHNAQELLLPRLAKTGDMASDGTPSSSGYGLVAVACNTKEEANEAKTQFIDKLANDTSSSWEWLSTSSFASDVLTSSGVPHTSVTFCHAASTPSVDIHPLNAGHLLPRMVGLGFLTIPKKDLLKSLQRFTSESLAQCGGSSVFISKALDVPASVFPVTNPLHASTQAHVDAFLTDLASKCVGYLQDDDCPAWLTCTVVDSLFVTCLGWNSFVTPFTQFDKRQLSKTQRAKEDPVLREYFETHAKLLPNHPVSSSGKELQPLSNTFAILPTFWDLVWPVVLYLVAKGIFMLLEIILNKWMEFREW
eukprot:TRINITY_DN6266_c1_g1_i1.p1 TRINITY_DN6266_c1_g1~~TRINITY_DN6266_c1_g1_i1.p1  ORF type:complete len:693 (+),score=106.58 TRINITY_DN6266_c1_g1_i1:52-2130(+)